MIDKARRVSPGAGNLIDGEYMFGENDYADSRLLKFLRISQEEFLEVVRAEPDDERAGARILEMSGKTPAECAAFRRRFLMQTGIFLPMMDADEGRRPPGAWTSFLRWFYNHAIAVPAIAWFRRADR